MPAPAAPAAPDDSVPIPAGGGAAVAAGGTAPRVAPGALLRLVFLGALLAAGAASVALVEPQRFLTEERLGSPSAAVLLLFTAGYALCTVLMVPRPVLGLAGGALFGWAIGTATALLGTLLGAAATFALGRVLGQRALRPLLRGKLLTAADEQLSSHGFRSLVILRLIPVLPFAAVNHAAAVSRMPWKPYLAATAVGCLPAVAAHAVAGHYATDPVSPGFLLAVAFLVLSTVVAGGYWRRRTARSAAPPAAGGEAVATASRCPGAPPTSPVSGRQR